MVLILSAALLVVGLRMQALVVEGPLRRARDLSGLYLDGRINLAAPPGPQSDGEAAGLVLGRVNAAEIGALSATNPFLASAATRFRTFPDEHEFFESATDADDHRFFRYARAIRGADVLESQADLDSRDAGDPAEARIEALDEAPPPGPVEGAARVLPSPEAGANAGGPESPSGRPGERVALEANGDPEADAETEAGDQISVLPPTDAEVEASLLPADPLLAVLLVEVRDREVAAQLLRNRVYIVAAGLLAGLLAIATFWFVTTRLVLSPVRVLRGYALRVADGDLSLRSDINTGDEFEQLSDVFNTMLENLKSKQDQLFRVNKSLDLKLVELAESNVTLYEANKMKNEFLANVSHELRTPLNSIIGFAEVLGATLEGRTGPIDEKRHRYASNIVLSSKRLLELINDLLDLAKIEAGRLEVRAAPVSPRDTCEGLAALIRPLAEKKNVSVRVKLEPQLPPLVTDAGKLQQILFNLLANAVKFSPPNGIVVLAVEAAKPRDGFGSHDEVAFRVVDQGPGVDPEDHEKIFEKFIQLETSVTREHGGTGLGLTISRELAELLGGTIRVESRRDETDEFAGDREAHEQRRARGGLTTRSGPGPGATFVLTLPRTPIDGRSLRLSQGGA